MKVAGIIAEYNPFHNGHLFQLESIRNKLGDDTAIAVIMSGNFVQRGEPAIASKWTRTKGALSSGVDLVIELPFTFACASADRFASGAVNLMDKLGIVSHLCFGSEFANEDILDCIAEILLEPPHVFTELLKEELKKGESFARARETAILRTFQNQANSSLNIDTVHQILNAPNAILAIEYLTSLKALHKKSRSHITPVIFHRKGAGYYDADENDMLSSAFSIRERIQNSWDDTSRLQQCIHLLSQNTPPTSGASLLYAWQKNEKPVFSDFFIYDFINALQIHQPDQLTQIAYMGDNLSNRLKNACTGLRLTDSASSESIQSTTRQQLYDIFKQKASTKRFANTRVNRSLISILTGQTQEDLTDLSEPAYIRVLGFSKKGQYLLRLMRKNADLPIFTKASDFLEHQSDVKLSRMAELDLISTEIWNQKAGISYGDEFNRQVIQVKHKNLPSLHTLA